MQIFCAPGKIRAKSRYHLHGKVPRVRAGVLHLVMSSAFCFLKFFLPARAVISQERGPGRKGIAKPYILTAKKETEVKSALIHQGLLCTEGRDAPALCARGEAEGLIVTDMQASPGRQTEDHWAVMLAQVDRKAKAKGWTIGMFHVNKPA